MPEGIEVELYRQAAESVVGRTVTTVETPDDWFLKKGGTGADFTAALEGETVTAIERIGKLLLLRFAQGGTLGLRFGMTGRIIVDDDTPIETLEYDTCSTQEKWVRFRLCFALGQQLAIHDPRRLGGVELEPDETKLGVDVFVVGLDHLVGRVLVGSVALKTRLMDQKRLAGVGNLICDETLWRAGLRPDRPAGSLSKTDQQNLHNTLLDTVNLLAHRGGSHRGDLQNERRPGGRCPIDDKPLTRATVGGRTSYFCDEHQC